MSQPLADDAAGESLADEAPGEPPADDAAQWQRLHPLTPIVRGWKVLAAMLVIVGQQRGPEMFDDGLPSRTEALVSLGLLAAAVVVGGVYAVLAWQRARYRVDDEALQLRTGVLFRQERAARLDRLQAVDVVRPILARIFGLAELKLEVAGGSDSAVRLSLLPEGQAQALRNTLLARAAGLTYEGEAAPEAPEREVLTVPVGRTIESSLRSGATVMGVVLLLVLVISSVVLRQGAPLVAVLPMALGFASVLWQRFQSAFGFRVATSPDGVRLHHGLLTTRAQTVPPGRVQAVRLSQPLLWRGRDWWRVEVNIAGYGGGGREEGQAQENVLLPVGTREEALGVLSLAMPPLSAQPSTDLRSVDAEPSDSWQRVLDPGLTGRGDDGGYLASPAAARWLDPISWRRHGVLVTPDVLLARRGVLMRQLDVVPHARTQSLGLEQGPLQRRLGLASFVVHSTRGPVSPSVQHLGARAAAELMHHQATRARTARADSGADDDGRWMASR